MRKTPIKTRLNIMSEFWHIALIRPELIEIARMANIGLPGAYLVSRGYVIEGTPALHASIEKAWDEMAIVFGLDPDAEYKDDLIEEVDGEKKIVKLALEYYFEKSQEGREIRDSIVYEFLEEIE